MLHYYSCFPGLSLGAACVDSDDHVSHVQASHIVISVENGDAMAFSQNAHKTAFPHQVCVIVSPQRPLKKLECLMLIDRCAMPSQTVCDASLHPFWRDEGRCLSQIKTLAVRYTQAVSTWH